MLTLLTWPVSFLLISAEWRKIQPSLLELDPGLRGLPLIRHLLLPVARPGLRLGALLTFVLALNNFGVPALLQTKVAPAEIWVSFNTTFDYTKAMLASWPLILAPLLFLLWVRRGHFEWPRLEGVADSRMVRRQLTRSWYLASLFIAAAVILLSLALPLGQLFISARTWQELPGAVAAGREAALNSLGFALGAAALSIAISLLGWRWKLGMLWWLLFLTPGVILGISLIFVFNRPPLTAFYQSSGIVMLGFVARYLALPWEGITRAMRSLDHDLVDSARLDGARRWSLLRHIQWPQIAATLAVSAYIVYVFCLWDVETLVFIVPPGAETLSLRIFNLLHYGHNSQVNALCLVLLGIAILPMLLWALYRAAIRLSHPRPVVLLAGLLVLAGCTEDSATEKSLDSRFFSKVQIIGTRGTAIGQFNKPRSIAVDQQDNFYVVDMTGRVQKFSPDGTFLLSWQMPQTDLGKPKGMCRDSDGNIVVIEPHYSRVNHFSPEGKLVAQWGVHGTNAGNLLFPRSACVQRDGTFFLSEYGAAERIQKFSKNGEHLIKAFGKAGLGPGELNRAEGLGLDPSGRLYVADSCNHRIQIFSPDGEFLYSFGKAGSGPGEFSYPYDVQIDANGYEYVCEFGNSRIQIFDAQHQFVEMIGGLGAAPGQFSNPWAMALDSAGNLYVADSRNHRVQKFIRRKGSSMIGNTAKPGGKSA